MNQQKYFSIVIPTMWKSDFLKEMLDLYENCELVKQVIIIDNKPQDKFDLSKYKKIIYWTKGRNIFVNPAWNIGAKLAKYNLILANDDILIKNIYDVLLEISSSDYDIIGISWEDVDNLKIEPIIEFPKKGYGCFMYIKKYVYIPRELKIWRGDYIQFVNSQKKGILMNPKLLGNLSETVRSSSEFTEIAKNDFIVFNNLIEEKKIKLE